jgi:hypothetical protein
MLLYVVIICIYKYYTRAIYGNIKFNAWKVGRGPDMHDPEMRDGWLRKIPIRLGGSFEESYSYSCSEML